MKIKANILNAVKCSVQSYGYTSDLMKDKQVHRGASYKKNTPPPPPPPFPLPPRKISRRRVFKYFLPALLRGNSSYYRERNRCKKHRFINLNPNLV